MQTHLRVAHVPAQRGDQVVAPIGRIVPYDARGENGFVDDIAAVKHYPRLSRRRAAATRAGGLSAGDVCLEILYKDCSSQCLDEFLQKVLVLHSKGTYSKSKTDITKALTSSSRLT